MSSRIDIMDQQNPILEAAAKESLIFSATDWWDTIPIMRRVTEFETWSEDKITEDVRRLQYFFIDQGYREVHVIAKVFAYQNHAFQRIPNNMNGYQVQYEVVLGALWYVSDIRIQGLPERMKISSLPEKMETFSRERQRKIEQEIKTVLRKEGYVNYSISWQSQKQEANQLILEAFVSLDQKFEFGTINFQLWNGLPVKPFLHEYQWYGLDYDPSRIRNLNSFLYDLSLYEDVETVETIDKNHQKVHLLFSLKPFERWGVKTTFGVGSEATMWALDGGIQWNFQNKTYALRGKHGIGYQSYPRLQYLDFSYQGLVTQQQLEFARPIYSSFSAEWFGRGGADLGTQVGYQDISLYTDIGLRWHTTPNWTLETALGFVNRQFYPMLGKEDMFVRHFGEEQLVEKISQPQLALNIKYLEQDKQWFSMETVPLALLNHSKYSRFYLEQETRHPFGRWKFVQRFRAGMVYWIDQPVDNLHNRFFLGGSGSVRGWSYRTLRVPSDSNSVFDVSTGGEKMLMGSLEVQYEVYPQYKVLIFSDGGRIWTDTKKDWSVPRLLFSGGIGLQIPTMVGNVIFAPSWQLQNADVQYPSPRFMTHVYLERALGN